MEYNEIANNIKVYYHKNRINNKNIGELYIYTYRERSQNTD